MKSPSHVLFNRFLMLCISLCFVSQGYAESESRQLPHQKDSEKHSDFSFVENHKVQRELNLKFRYQDNVSNPTSKYNVWVRHLRKESKVQEVFLHQLSDSSKTRKRKYYVWINYKNGVEASKGRLIRLNDSSILVKIPDTREIVVPDIYDLNYRKQGSVVRGVFIGMGTGIVLGATAGYFIGRGLECISFYVGSSSTSTGECAGFYAIPFGFLGFLIGTFIGLAAGLSKKQFMINGKQFLYEKHKEDMSKYQFN